jgi:hypothetical protein
MGKSDRETGNECRILLGNPLGKSRAWENIIKIYLMVTSCEDVN